MAGRLHSTVNPTVVLIDGDEEASVALADLLRRNEFDVRAETTARSGLRSVFDHRPALVLLDLDLPDLDGLEVLTRIRDLSEVPVMVVSERDREGDKVEGFGRGADDYVTKPYGNAELVARAHALLRRSRASAEVADATYRDDRLQVDFAAHEVRCDGRVVELTPTDWRLLAALVRHAGQVLDHDDLLELAWSDPRGVGHTKVKYAVLRLRQRLGWADLETSPIQAVRGFGYRYSP